MDSKDIVIGKVIDRINSIEDLLSDICQKQTKSIEMKCLAYVVFLGNEQRCT